MGSESKNGVGLSSPASGWSPKTSKVIQSLKEIVNCPEPEIYALLKECNMDPNEAVQRLLSQDTFHEVKSKRERKKEMREIQESKPRTNYSSASVRGSRSLSERTTGWNESSQEGYEEIGNVEHKVENVSVIPLPPLLHTTYHVKGETLNQHPSSFNSDSFSTDCRGQTIGTGDLIASTAGQPALLPTSSGHLSMADIVRMGKPASKSSHVSSEAASNIHSTVVTASDNFDEKKYQDPVHSQIESYDDLHSQNVYKSEISVSQDSFLDNPPVVERPTVASGSSDLEWSSCPEAEVHAKQSNGDEFKLSTNSHSSSSVAPYFAYASCGQDGITNAGGASLFDDSDPGNPSTLSQPNISSTLIDDVVAVSSALTKLEQPNLGEEPESKCAVVFPSHLLVLASDCPHLSFGTFKAPSNKLKDDHQESTTLSAEPPETRNLGFADNQPLQSVYDSHKLIAEVNHHTTNYKSTSAFTSELVNQEDSQESYGSESIRLPLRDSNFDKIGHTALELSFSKTDQNTGNLPTHNQPAHVESNELLSKFLSLSESESLQAQFLAKQSIPSRHGNTSMSFSEDRKSPAAFPLSSPSPAAPNQHRIVPSFSQHNLPQEQQTNNMMGYSSLRQNYSQLPSNFQQQAYSSRSDFNQSMGDLKYSLPQYGASLSRFPNPGASATSGTGNYGTSGNVRVNYLQSTTPSMVANSGYNGVLHPQYSDGNNFTSLQQNGNFSTWAVPMPRLVSSAQERAFYNLVGQNQRNGGLRQGQQQPTQYDGAFGSSNLYRSQPGVARDHQHQQQNFGGSTAGDSPDLLSQQMHRFWRQNH